MASVHIVLTFDDGPHAGPLGGGNRTERVLEVLRHKRIKAAFFIQTHVPHRLASPNGYKVASLIHAEGHVLAIHTGSLEDHRCHKWRCTQPADMAGAINGLDADMKRAKAAIKNIVGTEPIFVRATYGYTDANCMKVYSANKLKHVYWDVVSGDDSNNATSASIRTQLITETKALGANPINLIYLLHDISQVTAEHLSDFIDAIAVSVRSNGHAPRFVVDRVELESIMDSKSRPGTNNPCPPSSMG